MNKREELIVKYTNDLNQKSNHDSEMDLLKNSLLSVVLKSTIKIQLLVL